MIERKYFDRDLEVGEKLVRSAASESVHLMRGNVHPNPSIFSSDQKLQISRLSEKCNPLIGSPMPATTKD